MLEPEAYGFAGGMFWCRRDDFFNALPLLLRGEDPGFQAYMKRVAQDERGTQILVASH